MSGMLNTLLDINQIEAGVVRAEPVSFPINDLLDRLRDEFTYHAQAQKLTLRVVPCSLHVHSDPRLLEQMIRNLAVERAEIHQARQGAARLPPAPRRDQHRDLGYRHRHSRRRVAGDLRGVPSARQCRARTHAAVSALACPSCSAWCSCSATASMSARASARARCSPSRSLVPAEPGVAPAEPRWHRRQDHGDLQARGAQGHDPGCRGRSGRARTRRDAARGRGPSGHGRAPTDMRRSNW